MAKLMLIALIINQALTMTVYILMPYEKLRFVLKASI